MRRLLSSRLLWLAFRKVCTVFVCEWNLIFHFSPKGKPLNLSQEQLVLEHRVNQQKCLCQSIKSYLLVRCVIESDKISRESSSVFKTQIVFYLKVSEDGLLHRMHFLYFNCANVNLICWWSALAVGLVLMNKIISVQFYLFLTML